MSPLRRSSPTSTDSVRPLAESKLEIGFIAATVIGNSPDDLSSRLHQAGFTVHVVQVYDGFTTEVWNAYKKLFVDRSMDHILRLFVDQTFVAIVLEGEETIGYCHQLLRTHPDVKYVSSSERDVLRDAWLSFALQEARRAHTPLPPWFKKLNSKYTPIKKADCNARCSPRPQKGWSNALPTIFSSWATRR